MADFPQDKKYNKLWKRSSFNDTIFEGNNISELTNNSEFLNQEQTDRLYPTSQSFNDLNEVAIRSTTNFYIVDDFIDEYFDDVDEFFETYNTGSFSGSFEGNLSVKDVMLLSPLNSLPETALPGSLASLRNAERGNISLYFYNGSEWVLVT
jgi:hypothetical protein